MQTKIAVGISSCLLGEKVRYDGGHKLDPYLKDTVGRFIEWVPVCPEVECGLPVPREPMRLSGAPSSPRLITRSTGADHTDRMRLWGTRRLEELARLDLCGFVFKGRSPSSGLRGVRVYGPSATASKPGTGLFAAAFTARFPLVPVEDDGRLHDPGLRGNFFGRVFVFSRWKDFLQGGRSLRDLIEFHTRHKLLIMSHSTRHYQELGVLIAAAKNYRAEELQTVYFCKLMEAMKLPATTRKHANVLQHIMGYFKKQLSASDKAELLEVIGRYREGLIPLIVPVTLLNHYVRRFEEPYLAGQYYLSPHPMELLLSNHA